MANLKFLKGNYASLGNATIAEGQILVTKDTRELFVDVDASTRIKIGDFTVIGTLAELEALDATKVPTSRLYYVEDGNILARSNGTTWIQVNKQKSAEELKTLLGLGSAAYTDATAYDAAGSADAVRTYVGEIPEGYTEETVIAYVNKKAEETLNAASGGSSESAASVLAALNTYKSENDPRVTANTNAIAAIKDGTTVDSFADVETELAKKVDKAEGKSLVADTEIARLAAMSDGANKVEASETNGNIKIDGVETVVYTHPEKHAIADVDGLQDALDGKQAAGDYATKTEAQGYADAKDDAIAEAKKAGEDAQGAIDAYIESNDAALAGVKATAEAAAVATEVEAALALKADKSVVDAMYTNEQIDNLVQGAKDYADTNDADTKYGIVYDSDNKKIKLVEGGAEVEIDATEFIKDGMIETVALSDDGLNLVITWNTDAGKSETTIPLTGLVDVYTGVSSDRIVVSVSSDDKISADLVAGSISKNYLDEGVQASLAKADSALQKHQDISHLATEADLTLAENRISTLEAIDHDAYVAADAALKTKLQGEIDADVKVVNDALEAYKTSNDAEVAKKANSADVYAKTETYTKSEIEALLTWGEF